MYSGCEDNTAVITHTYSMVIYVCINLIYIWKSIKAPDHRRYIRINIFNEINYNEFLSQRHLDGE